MTSQKRPEPTVRLADLAVYARPIRLAIRTLRTEAEERSEALEWTDAETYETAAAELERLASQFELLKPRGGRNRTS